MLKPNQTTVIIRAKKGRHVFVGENVLSHEFWSEHPISPSIVKAIKEGDIVEGTVEDIAPPPAKAGEDIAPPPAKAGEDKK